MDVLNPIAVFIQAAGDDVRYDPDIRPCEAREGRGKVALFLSAFQLPQNALVNRIVGVRAVAEEIPDFV